MDNEVVGGIPSRDWYTAEKYIQRAGLRLHYLDAKRSDWTPSDGRPTIVMLHGMNSHGDSWRPIVSRLTSVGRVLCPDLRGHGHSDWSRDGYWLRDYAADVLALIESLNLGSINLVGHSLGARVSMVLAPMLGSRLGALALSDTGPEVTRTAAQHVLGVNASNKSVAGLHSDDELRGFLTREFPTFTEESIDVRARRLYRRNWAGMLVHRSDPEVAWLLGRAGLEEVPAMWAGLAATVAPVLILKAAKSLLLDDDLASRMTDVTVCSALIGFDLSHYLIYEDPESIARVLDQFFAEPARFIAAAAECFANASSADVGKESDAY